MGSGGPSAVAYHQHMSYCVNLNKCMLPCASRTLNVTINLFDCQGTEVTYFRSGCRYASPCVACWHNWETTQMMDTDCTMSTWATSSFPWFCWWNFPIACQIGNFGTAPPSYSIWGYSLESDHMQFRHDSRGNSCTLETFAASVDVIISKIYMQWPDFPWASNSSSISDREVTVMVGYSA